MQLRQLFDSESFTYTYLLFDEKSLDALIIDPVWEKRERDLNLIQELKLKLKYIFETHVHADHATSAAFLKSKTKALIGLSKDYNLGKEDISLRDGDKIKMGEIDITVISTPGHTVGCLSYLIAASIFTGDTLFVRGNGRTDFQGGSAEILYHSIKNKIYTLPEETKIYPGHDYNGYLCSTVAEEKKYNKRINDKTKLEEFVHLMNNLNLDYPKKIKEVLPINLTCGESLLQS